MITIHERGMPFLTKQSKNTAHLGKSKSTIFRIWYQYSMPSRWWVNNLVVGQKKICTNLTHMWGSCTLSTFSLGVVIEQRVSVNVNHFDSRNKTCPEKGWKRTGKVFKPNTTYMLWCGWRVVHMLNCGITFDLFTNTQLIPPRNCGPVNGFQAAGVLTGLHCRMLHGCFVFDNMVVTGSFSTMG